MPENVFAMQEQLASDLASRLAQPYDLIHEVTADSFRRGRPETLFAYDCVLRAFAYRRTEDPKLYGPARACLEEAVRRDPGYADAWALLAFSYLDEYRYGYPAALAEIERLTDAVGFWTLVLLAAIHGERDNQAEARVALERAKALNPNFLRDPWGGMRIHHFPEDLIEELIDGLRKAGLGAFAGIN
jgi:tetratricopeptide (TPR) repeat protein